MEVRFVNENISQMLKKCSLESRKKRYYNERIAIFTGIVFPV